MKLLLGLVWPCCGYIIVIISFITFVISNGGLVVGDKSAHQAEINLPQLFYFSFFVIAFALPYFIVRIKSFLKFVLQHKLFSALCMLLFVIITRYNTVVHPYLLADNRHYVFYLWKAFYERRVMPKYLLSPVYFFGLYSIISHLKNKSFLFLLGYFVSLVVSIVPQKLLEYRYYILPFMVFRININNLSWLQLSAELLFFLVINVMSIYIFASKEFYWADSKEIQRIIW
ncbi:hypothetical protein AAG570_007707 [Ranatra chinensis]|uniref:Dol-P-Glc:Glc(2)Man(9)GlcNAc(2)-PP-Dol alpha-1,2-glucosyltransferase n=1 Tax=Ranatra chinensis TaxID=642074 RepID=A0ABD0Y9K5_9HEMI